MSTGAAAAEGAGGAGGAAGGGQGPNPAAAMQAAAVPLPSPIIYSPWQGDIDLNTKHGKALWDEGIRPIESKFTGQGKDLVRFLALVANQVSKCFWQGIITVDNKNLLTQYGEIPRASVINAREARNSVPVTSLATARPRINALMMYHFTYNSLGEIPQKKLNTRLTEIEQDGPLLLKTVLDDTFIATTASTFTIKEQFYDLHLKKYRWNVINLNQDVREKCVDLVAAGHKSDETDIIIALFRAYNTSTNDEFKSSILFWKHEWNSGVFTTREELMTKADAKYVELRNMGTWGKRSEKDQQIVALTAKIEELTKGSFNAESASKNNDKKDDSSKSKTAKWKYDRSLSQGPTYTRNDKTYHWCTGPGHNGRAMWTIHKPGTCVEKKNDTKTSGSKRKSV